MYVFYAIIDVLTNLFGCEHRIMKCSVCSTIRNTNRKFIEAGIVIR